MGDGQPDLAVPNGTPPRLICLGAIFAKYRISHRQIHGRATELPDYSSPRVLRHSNGLVTVTDTAFGLTATAIRAPATCTLATLTCTLDGLNTAPVSRDHGDGECSRNLSPSIITTRLRLVGGVGYGNDPTHLFTTTLH